MFCIREAMPKIASTALPNGSIQSPTISQNAGCTMALHADCTKAKTLKKYKLLIYKEF
jgi:hypothetical protein